MVPPTEHDHAASDGSASQGARPRLNLTKARGERTREVILEEATALFSTHGYRGASLRDISERVGISHPGMLHHFSHKDVLLKAVLTRAYDAFEKLIDEFIANSQTPEALRNSEALSDFPSVMFAVVRAEALDSSHPAYDEIVKMQRMAEEKLTGHFSMFAQKGWLADGVQPDFVARALISLWTGEYMREGVIRDGKVQGDMEAFLRLAIPLVQES